MEEENSMSGLGGLIKALDQPVKNESDLTGVIKTINEDSIEPETDLPSIDMKTRLAPFELCSMVIHDTIIALDCLPKVCMKTTRMKKRLAVSLLGQGRKEVVTIVSNERERESKSFMSKMMGGSSE